MDTPTSTEVAAPIVEVPAVATPATVETPAPEVEQKEPRVYTQEEVDRIAAKIKKNTRYTVKREFEAFNSGRDSVAPAKTAEPAAVVNDAPTRDQFDSYEAFLEAKAAHVGNKAATEAVEKREKAEQERTAKESAERVARTFQEKTRERFPTINDAIDEIGDMPMYRGVQAAIQESEFGPEIFNDLVSKPSEFDRLMKLSETAAIREIGKIEAKHEANKKPPTEEKKPSAAPSPIKPLVGKAASTDDDLTKLVDNPDAWALARNRQIQKRRSGTK